VKEKNGSNVDGMSDEPEDISPDERSLADAAPRTPSRKAGFFSVYKKGQGYWTRMGTAIGAAILVAVLALYTYSETKAMVSLYNINPRLPLIATAGVVLAAVIVAWVLMNKPRNVDFLIATDGEMNKVNWTSRKELLGSTRIVIIFMFAIAMVLFLIDVLAGGLFQLIGLLRVGPLF
jgi:preprotein translocase SecE subunit